MDNHEEQREDSSGITILPIGAAQHGPPPEVRFVGVLGEDPRLQITTMPNAYRSHPLVKDHFFYTIPEQLLRLVCQPQTNESFEVNEELLEMEFELSRISGDHGSRVGFWNDTPIECNLMHALPLRREDLEQFDHLSKEQIDDILRKFNQRLGSFSEISCGYAGWLMTNPDFLSELETLTSHWDQQMHRWGTALVGLPIPSIQPPGRFNPTGEIGWKDYDSAVLEFCIRWRLQGLAGPRIPIPMRPMMSGQFPLSIVQQLMRAGGLFNWPDTFPLFARDELRELLADALRSSSDSTGHLAGWHEITDSKNKAKNQIPAFERLFRLQHFWLLLRERHPNAFVKRLHRIEAALANYFGVDESSIRLDRTKISSTLGKDWDQSSKATVPLRRPR